MHSEFGHSNVPDIKRQQSANLKINLQNPLL